MILEGTGFFSEGLAMYVASFVEMLSGDNPSNIGEIVGTVKLIPVVLPL